MAFSGEVHAPNLLVDPVTEMSALLNPNLRGRDMQEAFATDEYQIYATAEPSDVTNPNLVFDLRAKLDAAGHYDDLEVERVALVEMHSNPRKPCWWPPSSRWRPLTAALELTLMLGPLMGRALRQSLEMSEGDFSIFLTCPLSGTLLAIAVLVIVISDVSLGRTANLALWPSGALALPE